MATATAITPTNILVKEPLQQTISTQNDLIMSNLLNFYKDPEHLECLLSIINESKMSLRIVDWFATNYAKKFYTVYNIDPKDGAIDKYPRRFKVFVDYKLKLKAYSKRRFDPFCRWQRTTIPYKQGSHILTTIGQLNFFKWAIENEVIQYIEDNYEDIQRDMKSRNSKSRRKNLPSDHSDEIDSLQENADLDIDINNDDPIPKNIKINKSQQQQQQKTRKKREELSKSASRTIRKEDVEIVMRFA